MRGRGVCLHGREKDTASAATTTSHFELAISWRLKRKVGDVSRATLCLNGDDGLAGLGASRLMGSRGRLEARDTVWPAELQAEILVEIY